MIVAIPGLLFYPSISLSLASPLRIGSFALRNLIQLWSYDKKNFQNIKSKHFLCNKIHVYVYIFVCGYEKK